MPRFAANLSMMFQEHPFLDRFAAAAAAGFAGVEFLFPYDHPAGAIAERLQRHGLTQALFNLPPGDWAAGERGLASLPGREEEFRRSVERAIGYARALGCRTVHCMAGLLPDEGERATRERLYVENLRHAARACGEAGLTLLIEPINTRDMPGYLLNYQGQARRLIEAVGAPNLRLQLDLYHCQIMEGDLARHIREYLPITGHVQIAGVPERHEPDRGEVNYRYLFDLLDELGYAGWVGCEYRPHGRTEDGLGWFAPYRRHG
ncbi:2-oxo-tetronate isomerase [Benzoatithermus flavus]|uniref:2-oxo-tetronate isomerase n=1 Tax=Benzoatithermus flavus TaxID=3108223 RepID=A0ABU8XVD4_9PROT